METPHDNVPEASFEPPAVKLDDPKVINGWALFDWANSAFALVITVAVFPGYFQIVTTTDTNNGVLDVFGLKITNSSLFAFCISIAYFIIALLSPLLSGIADYGGKKKYFLRLFTTIGSIACMSLFLFTGVETLAIGSIGFILGVIGFAGGLVFYNSYLPEIASEPNYDRVSARGFALGYIGSILLLIVNLLMISFPTWFGLPEKGTLPAQLSFLMVGLWWIGFAQIPFKRLPADPQGKSKGNLVSKGMDELRKVWRAVKQQHNTKFFLFSFFCYSAGVQTILYLASTFATKELEFAEQELIILVLILQLVAVVGAYLASKLSEWKGNKVSLITMLIIWALICVAAYIVFSKIQFYLVAAGVGMVMGGIQSLSRSTYSKLLPVDTKDTTSYFSFYDVLEKVAIILGTFIFGFFELITGSMRNSVLVLAVFFVASIFILLKVRIKPAEQTI
ncbi:MAG: MFS transporter [Saprospiraceae bacterium]